eukprot:TRINITY_DN6391_c0_g1_i1.p1 TRINITY_DN6391_c0_g1~~TRINITY_DN6391_c0_g1_i1.p1  ORF type:complete len:785 (-),score=139.13 TRINITY_DN6391_c0_g1_i1:163-2517(-)
MRPQTSPRGDTGQGLGGTSPPGPPKSKSSMSAWNSGEPERSPSYPGSPVHSDAGTWERQTQLNLNHVRALRMEAQSKLFRGSLRTSGAALPDEASLLLGGASVSSVQDKLKRRLASCESLAVAVLDRMESTDHMIHRVDQWIHELQRTSGSLYGALSVVEKRIEMRATRPPSELVRDGFSEALEKEKASILRGRQQLCQVADEGREILTNLEAVAFELGRDRHTLPQDRSSRPHELLAKARRLEEEAHAFCNDIGTAARVKAEAEREVDRATARTHAAMKRRIAELVEIRRQLEAEVKETQITLTEAEWQLDRNQKQLKHYLAKPEASDESMNDFVDSMRSAFQAPVMCKLRAKIKGASYTGSAGRSLETLFGRFDKDGSGQLDEDEVRLALRRTMRIPPSSITDAEISNLCNMLDADKSGQVSIGEIMAFLAADTDPKVLKAEIASTKSIIEKLVEALHKLQTDLRCKTAAWKVDEACTKVTQIKGLELDGLPPAARPNTSTTVKTPRIRRFAHPLAPEVQDKIRSKIKAAAYTGTSGKQLEVLFSRFDKDGTGEIDDDGLRRALRRVLRIPPSAISDQEIVSFCALLDNDNSGTVSVDEIVKFVGAEPASKRGKSRFDNVLEPIKTVDDMAPGSARQKEAAAPPKPRKKGPPLSQEQIDKVRARIKGAAYTGASGKNLDVVFSRFDKDGTGQLDDDEVRRAVRRTFRIPPSDVSDQEISSLCALLDDDNSGSVSIEELVAFVGQEPASKRAGKVPLTARKLEPMHDSENDPSNQVPRQTQSR